MRIAQITDTHIKPYGVLAYNKVDTEAYLKAAVAHINAMADDLDGVVFTGDLVDAGKQSEYQQFRDIVSDLALPFHLVCGNHDDRGGIRTAFPDHHYPGAGDDPLQYVIEWEGLTGIVLDSSVPGQPYGQFCKARLAWLESVLQDRVEQPAMIFMHHPPFLTGIQHMDVQNLKESAALFEVIGKAGQVRHIACGHVHRACETVIQGISVSIAPSPAHAVALDFDVNAPPQFCLEPPMLRIFNIPSNGEIVSHLSPIGYFPGPYPFYNADGSLI